MTSPHHPPLPASTQCAEPALRTPPASFRCARRAFRDADEHAEALGAWDQRYEQLTPGRFAGHVTETWIDDVQVFRERTNQMVFQSGRAWPGACIVGLIVASGGDAAFRDHSLPARSGFAFGAPGEFSLRAPRDFDVIGIAVPATLLRDDPEECAVGAEPAIVPAVLSDSAALRRLGTFALAFLDAVDDGATAVFDRPEARRALVSSLLVGVDDVFARADGVVGGRSSGRSSGQPILSLRSRTRLVERAREHLHAQREVPVTVAELCAALGVSRRTLQYSFQEVLGVSPVQFLRALRLNGVRRELRRTTPDERVGDVAARWGFWHPSQFAADYRTMFGERPSETPRRER
jgi:AraC family transcriptional regulator, ethanolamine operon transcriptional activator